VIIGALQHADAFEVVEEGLELKPEHRGLGSEELAIEQIEPEAQVLAEGAQGGILLEPAGEQARCHQEVEEHVAVHVEGPSA
jgi:hypothetical protein